MKSFVFFGSSIILFVFVFGCLSCAGTDPNENQDSVESYDTDDADLYTDGDSDGDTDSDSDGDSDGDTDSDPDNGDSSSDGDSDRDGDSGADEETVANQDDVEEETDPGGYEMTGPPGEEGSYDIDEYNRNYNNKEGRGNSTIRYPVNTSDGEVFPAIVVAPGASFTKEDMKWIGTHLSPHGFITISITPPQLYNASVVPWGVSLLGAIEMLKEEAASPDSPIYGLWDQEKIGAIGYSAGGGGAMVASNRNDEVDTVVGIAPAVNIPFDGNQTIDVDVPSLVIGGSADNTVPANACVNYYKRQPSPKAVIVVKGSSHWVNTNGSLTNRPNVAPGHQAIAKKYFTAWFQYFLKDLTDDYQAYLFGDEAQKDLDDGLLTQLKQVAP